MASIAFISLGCDKNTVDAEKMAAKLMQAGHCIVDSAGEADVTVVNTCAFVESAREESIGWILQAAERKKEGRTAALVVTGCLAERYRDQVTEEFPELDAVVVLSGNASIVGVIEDVLRGKRVILTQTAGGPDESGGRHLLTPAHYAYLKIAEGCDNHCTFCSIPAIRGRYRSRPTRDIVAEAQSLVRGGVKELILVAQDTTSYGRDLGLQSGLAVLVEQLAALDGLWKVRLLYAYPEYFDDELIRVMAANHVIARYADIPFQHADDEMLRRMGRRTTAQKMVELIEKLQRAMPDIVLRSSFIVGFPGETEAQFMKLFELTRRGITRGGSFIYSAEEGTPAAGMAGQIGAGKKQRRYEQFELFQSRLLSNWLQARIGSRMQVICDGTETTECGEQVISCRSEYDAPDVDTRILLPADCGLRAGQLAMVEITGCDGFDLTASLAN